MTGWKMSERQRGLCVMGAVVVLLIPVLRGVVLPTWREWSELRGNLGRRWLEHGRLSRNLSRKSAVDAEFGRLEGEAWQTEADSMTLASWLRELEVMARLPGMSINSMKALPVKDAGSYRLYRVRVSVSGKLPEVMRFVSEATNGSVVTGLEGFSLRGAQGPNAVECSVALRMVRLTSEKTPPSAVGARKAGWGKGVGDGA